MGISRLLEYSFPTPTSCCTEQHCRDRGKQSENAHQSQKSSAEGWVLGLTVWAANRGGKSHTHTLHEHPRLPCTKDQRQQRNKECTEIICGIFFLCFLPVVWVWLHSSLAQCKTSNRRAWQNFSAVLELNFNSSVFLSQQQWGEPAAAEAKGRYFGAHSDTRLIFLGIIWFLSRWWPEV